MKSKTKILIMLLFLIMYSTLSSKKATAQQPNVSFQVFYDQLNPYGQWVDYPNYGYVWIPYAGPDFAPYSSRGHWILTEYGFTWVSDYNWGWAPFHYGRWDFDNYYGWFWIPDNEWGPAWVNWRSANGYYGWAPMEPGISISVSFGRGYDRQRDHWIFVRDRDIDRSNINRYYVNRIDHDRIIRDSRMIENTYFDSRRNTKYISGPTREDIQKVTGRRVNPVSIQESDKPGQDLRNGQLRIYRPEVIKNNDREQRPAPSSVTNLKDIKRPAERNTINRPRTAPSNNNRNGNQQNTANPQRNNINSNTVQPQKESPVLNRREVQQNAVTPANSNSKAAEPQNVKPTQGSRKVKQTEVGKSTDKKKAEPPTKVKKEEVRKEKN